MALGPAHVDDANTLAHWKLDEVTLFAGPIDSSGHLAVGVAAGTYPGAGLVQGYSRFFLASSSQYLAIASNTALRAQFNAGGPLRWNAVVQRSVAGNGAVFGLTSSTVGDTGGSANNDLLAVDVRGNGNTTARVYWQYGTANAYQIVTGVTPIALNQPVYLSVVMVPNGANCDAYLYVNGVLDASAMNVPRPLNPGTPTCYIGSRRGGSGNFWDGAIDDVFIESVSRTAAEILADYNTAMAIAPTVVYTPPAPAPAPPPTPVVPQQVDHAASALARVAQYLRDSPRFVGILTAFANRAQDLETALQAFPAARSLATGAGAQLDALGAIVGQARQGMSDADYRRYLQARVKVNRSSGTPEELLAMLRLAVSSATTIALVEYPPAAFVVRLDGAAQVTAQMPAVSAFLGAAKAAGVHATIEWFESAATDVLRLDAGPGLDTGHLAGAL